MSTAYNPRGLRDNCGYCSISKALELQGKQKTFRDADQLYHETVERLGVSTAGNPVPISRQLIFPDSQLGSLRPRPGYEVLGERGRSLDDYAVTSVASSFKLEFRQHTKNASQVRQGSAFLPEQFVRFYAKHGPSHWDVREFLEMRLDFLAEQGRNPSMQGLRTNLESELVGNAIIGSKDSNHYMTMQIDPDFHVIGVDPQDGATYGGAGLLERLQSIDLFMHLK